MKDSYKGALLIALSSLGFALMPIFARYAYKSTITIPTLLFIRFALAALFMFVYAAVKLGKVTVNKQNLFGLFLLGGIGYTLQSTLYFSAVKYIAPSLAVLILYSSPVIVALLSFFIDREKLSVKIIASMAISFVGLIFIVGTSIGQVDPAGIACAGGAAVVYSLYIILSNRVVKNVPPLVTTAYVALFAAAGLFLSGLAGSSINFSFSADTWLPILGLVFFSTILSILTFFAGLELLGPTRASILGMLEPLFTILFSAVFLGEGLGWLEVLGGAAIITGAILVVKSQGDKEKEEAQKAMKNG